MGWRGTYVMTKGSMIRPLVEHFDELISLDKAKEKAIAAILYAAHKAQRRFLDLPGLTWFKHNGIDPRPTVDAILSNWSEWA